MTQKIILCILIPFFFSISLTPAYAINQTFFWDIKPELNINIPNSNITIGTLQDINILISNDNDYFAAGNLTMKIGKKIGTLFEYPKDWLIVDIIGVVVENGTVKIITAQFETMNITAGEYKAYAKFYYNESYTTAYALFNIYEQDVENVADDITENITEDNETIIEEDLGGKDASIFAKFNKEAYFGETILIDTDVFVGQYKGLDLRIIGYISGPKKISRDLDETTLYQKYCDTDTAIEMLNATDTRLFIPLILKDDCKKQYTDGTYHLTVRLCNKENETFAYTDVMFKDTIFVKHTDKMSEICKKNTIYIRYPSKTVYLEKNCTQEMIEPKTFDISKLDNILYVNKPFEIVLKITNQGDSTSNYSVYSYAYYDGTLKSLGFGDNIWTKTWTGNVIDFKLEANETQPISLWNKITENLTDAKLKIKIYSDGALLDVIEKEITVIYDTTPQNIIINCSFDDDEIMLKMYNSDINDKNVSIILIQDNEIDEKKIIIKSKKNNTITWKTVYGTNILIAYSDEIYSSCKYEKEKSVKTDLITENLITGNINAQNIQNKRSLFTKIMSWIR
ncbi:MAG: hypothetical protein K0B02_00880 [DPANN group archaeon]|nr:hypothetical protein [DPANN group archaeon]